MYVHTSVNKPWESQCAVGMYAMNILVAWQSVLYGVYSTDLESCNPECEGSKLYCMQLPLYLCYIYK